MKKTDKHFILDPDKNLFLNEIIMKKYFQRKK